MIRQQQRSECQYRSQTIQLMNYWIDLIHSQYSFMIGDWY